MVKFPDESERKSQQNQSNEVQTEQSQVEKQQDVQPQSIVENNTVIDDQHDEDVVEIEDYEPKNLEEEFSLKRPPQSWCYVEE